MKIKCISDKEINGITINTCYHLIDTDVIGYRIIDDHGRHFWYIREHFEAIEEARDKILN